MIFIQWKENQCNTIYWIENKVFKKLVWRATFNEAQWWDKCLFAGPNCSPLPVQSLTEEMGRKTFFFLCCIIVTLPACVVACTGRAILTDSSGSISDGEAKYDKYSRCEWLIDGRFSSCLLQVTRKTAIYVLTRKLPDNVGKHQKYACQKGCR